MYFFAVSTRWPRASVLQGASFKSNRSTSSVTALWRHHTQSSSWRQYRAEATKTAPGVCSCCACETRATTQQRSRHKARCGSTMHIRTLPLHCSDLIYADGLCSASEGLRAAADRLGLRSVRRDCGASQRLAEEQQLWRHIHSIVPRSSLSRF